MTEFEAQLLIELERIAAALEAQNAPKVDSVEQFLAKMKADPPAGISKSAWVKVDRGLRKAAKAAKVANKVREKVT